MKPLLAIACVLGFFALQTVRAQQAPAAIVGSISSTSPVIVDGTALSPTGAPSWPVVERDEITTQAPALLTTPDHNLVTFDQDSKAKVMSTTDTNQLYVFMRQGGLSFDARSHIFICIGNRLFVPDTLAKGVLRLDTNGSVFQRLDSGAFVEQGARSCNDTGSGSFLSGVPRAAGGTAGAPPPPVTTTNRNRAIAAALFGIGAGVASGLAASSGGCPAAGCNANPPAISTIAP